MKNKKGFFKLYIRNFIFGVEDSLVSTVGLLSGVASAGMSRSSIILAGVVLIFVEAFSMAVGSFLSEHSVEGYDDGNGGPKKISKGLARRGGTIMFFSYFFTGFIPLFPYLVFGVGAAFWISIGLSLASLFALGVAGGKIVKKDMLHFGLEMFVIGGVAIGIGVMVGKLIPIF